MSLTREEHIEALVADHRPVAAAGRTGLHLGLWLAASVGFVVAVTWATGPLRPGLPSVQLLVELGLGLGVVVLGALGALRLGQPQPRSVGRRITPALLATVGWLALLALAMWAPALEPTMAGKREGCEHWVFALGLPPLLLGLAGLRRFAPFGRVLPGALLGAAAGAIPAVVMQVACMYDPIHALELHTLPVLGLVGVGAALGPLTLRRI
ncbi:MAG: NrsF family protein [Myxococcota bacterium]|nr:NrsF family protein [Myxococcota bacterium]